MKWSRLSRSGVRFFASLGIGLVLRQSGVEGGLRERMRLDARNRRPVRDVEFDATGIGALRNQADIRDGRRVAVAERAGFAVARECGFQRIEADGDPVTLPGDLRGGVRAE